MKLNIKIDTSVEEPEALITTPRMSEEVNKIVDYIGKLNEEPTVVSGVKDDKVEILEQSGLIKAYAEGGKVFAKTERGLYQVRLRLYELEERLDGDGIFYPCVPSFTERYGNEVTAVIVQTILSAVLGGGFSMASLIWEMDDWSLLKQTGVYFAIITILMMTVAYICEWMEHSLRGVLSYFGIFFAIFVVIWVIRYMSWKIRISKIKEKLIKNE